MEATTQRVRRVRRMISDRNYAFSDAELAELLEESSSIGQAILMAIFEMMTAAARFHSYTTGIRKEDKHQVFNNIYRMFNQLRDILIETGEISGPLFGGDGEVAVRQQVGMYGLTGTGPQSTGARDYSRLVLPSEYPWDQ